MAELQPVDTGVQHGPPQYDARERYRQRVAAVRADLNDRLGPCPPFQSNRGMSPARWRQYFGTPERRMTPLTVDDLNDTVEELKAATDRLTGRLNNPVLPRMPQPQAQPQRRKTGGEGYID
jgi:hypothetical protein